MRFNFGMIARHADDAAFLWSRWQRMLRSNHLTQAERAELEQRLDAHLEALALAGDAGWDASVRQLQERCAPESFFVAAAVATDGGNVDRFGRILSLAGPSPTRLGAMVSAIGRANLAVVEPWLTHFASSAIPSERVVGLRGLGAHRRHVGPQGAESFDDPEPAVRAAAAKVAGELGEGIHVGALRMLLRDGDLAVRFASARSLARLGDGTPELSDVLLAACEPQSMMSERAVAALVSLSPYEAPTLFRRWASQTHSRCLALVAAEEAGSTEFVGELISWMNDDTLARSAGDTLRTIVGADLKVLGLARPRPSHVPGDPTDDPSDPSIDLPRDYELPFPAAENVAAWWAGERERFTSGRRYLGGRDVGTEAPTRSEAQLSALDALARDGRPRMRTIAAGALARSRPTLPSVETHAFSRSSALQARASH